jgi:cobalamin biosynthesis Mg chelatase CobN
MIPELLKSDVFQAVVEAAQTKNQHNPAMLRAIERAVVEITRAAYWSFDGATLRLKSTTSKKLYVVTAGQCVCEARGVCKHRVARQLLQRYTESLAALASPARQTVAETAPLSATAQPSPIPTGAMAVPTNYGERYNGWQI